METDDNHEDLEACLRTFKKLVYKIDDMNSKLTHIIENLQQIYFKHETEESERYKKFFKEYEKYDQPDDYDESFDNGH